MIGLRHSLHVRETGGARPLRVFTAASTFRRTYSRENNFACFRQRISGSVTGPIGTSPRWRTTNGAPSRAAKSIVCKVCLIARSRSGRRRSRKVAIGRGAHHLDRQRTEIMQTAELDFTRFKHLLNTRHERNADAVSELDAIEAELVLDLAQHLVARGVAAGIPAGGK